MFAAGKPVWYLPLAVCAIAALVFTIFRLGYDRYTFINHQNAYPGTLTTFLSVDTITALKEDARLHHALLGLTESLARTSSDIGQRYGFEGVKSFGTFLTDSVTELRKRHDIKSPKRGLVDDMSQAMGNLLGGTSLNTTGGLSAIVGNLGSVLSDGLATPALFLGIGVGYVQQYHLIPYTRLTCTVLALLPG
jgi:hypothetical protein